MILVLGGTGTVGGAVLRHLADRGADVRAALRSPERAGALPVPVRETVVADLADPASLRDAVRGVDAAFLATPASPRQPELEAALVDALAGGDVHLVTLAALGHDGPPEQRTTLAGNHARVVRLLRGRGVRHTVLAPSGFATNLLRSAATVREGTLYGSSGDGRMSWVDPEDVAAVAVTALTGPGPGDGAGVSHDVTGPEVLTDTVQRLTGRPPRALADWLAAHRGAFAGG